MHKDVSSYKSLGRNEIQFLQKICGKRAMFNTKKGVLIAGEITSTVAF